MIEGTANGVTGSINSSTERTAIGVSTGRFSAHSSGYSLPYSSWISMGKIIEPWLNLEKNQAFGVWIKGGGNG